MTYNRDELVRQVLDLKTKGLAYQGAMDDFTDVLEFAENVLLVDRSSETMKEQDRAHPAVH